MYSLVTLSWQPLLASWIMKRPEGRTLVARFLDFSTRWRFNGRILNQRSGVFFPDRCSRIMPCSLWNGIYAFWHVTTEGPNELDCTNAICFGSYRDSSLAKFLCSFVPSFCLAKDFNLCTMKVWGFGTSGKSQMMILYLCCTLTLQSRLVSCTGVDFASKKVFDRMIAVNVLLHCYDCLELSLSCLTLPTLLA